MHAGRLFIFYAEEFVTLQTYSQVILHLGHDGFIALCPLPLMKSEGLVLYYIDRGLVGLDVLFVEYTVTGEQRSVLLVANVLLLCLSFRFDPGQLVSELSFQLLQAYSVFLCAGPGDLLFEEDFPFRFLCFKAVVDVR